VVQGPVQERAREAGDQPRILEREAELAAIERAIGSVASGAGGWWS
jgi:hypothetical protein